MSYAIIRNTKYKRENLKGIFRHNERRNKNYSNENIDKEKSYLNYSLKSPQYSYEKEFDRIKEKYNLKGQIKTVSNIACEYIITSDHDYFEGIGEEETKRFFETAYKFVSEYKDLGEQYIMSAKVHMDEQTPHMHLVFLPVVHTTDKKGNDIDKLACSEFWKAKDSYRQLQDAFYKFMVETDININRLSKKRDEKILEEIIKPKDNVIQNLYQDNMNLHRQLSRQAQVIEEAEKYQKERDRIMADNEKLHCEVDNIKTEYDKKEFELEWKYTNRINKLEKENNFLHKVVDRFKETIDIFITWICKKFDMGAENNLIRDFERENNILLDAEKQIKHEEREKDLEMEI